MKILTIHADFIEFAAQKKAFKGADDSVDKGVHKVKECLVVFTAVEKRDEKNTAAVVQKYVQEIKNIAQQVNAKTLVLYPYAHLSSTLAAPKIAEEVLKDAEKILAEKYSVTRAPFGWYKSFTISCKGHPLSELSREFSVDDAESKHKHGSDESKALAAEKTLVSQWFILDGKGKLNPLTYNKEKKKFNGFEFTEQSGLQKLAAYEMAKSRVANEEPPHVHLMRKLELVDYEPGSDPGNLRYYPKGRFIKGLIERWVTQKTKEYGGMEIESPIMYDFEHPSLKSYLNRFPARQYTIQTPNKKVFLRFAACFGQFLEMHDAQVSYKHLPVWLYELTRYSFRAEQHGELTGLRRLRSFTMPDCHAFCADEAQAKSEMKRRFQLAKEVQEGIGLKLPDDLEFAIRMTKDFWEQNKDFVTSLVKEWGKPALVEMWNERFFYYSMKYEWNFVDALDKCSALTTDQIDVENAERYDINYVDKEGKKRHPLILHLSPSGAVERIIYALLEKAAMEEKVGKVPSLPLWLAPTQVRLIPVSLDNHFEYCQQVAAKLNELNIRVDIDDRLEGVGKRIRTAALEWVPYTLVIGDNEMHSFKNNDSKSFVVRDREKNEELKMSFTDLVAIIDDKTKGRPFDTLPLPKLVSKRISFVGG
ncbi:MAG: threonine--tRNA ligase [Nanoarchaeota archaeon]|nr:threonine--tRNA ligase [Nanoarchaeota archaeon]